MHSRRQQAAWGRIGGLTAWSRHGAETMLGPARRGFIARFEHMVDPTGNLSPDERARRAQRALRAHMLQLAARSAEVRRTSKKATLAGSSARVAKEDADAPGEPPETA